MEIASLPPDESARLAALNQCEILDTDPEEAFDSLTRLAAQICGTSIALVCLIDANRQWFKSKVGIEVSETLRSIAFCAHAIHQSDILIVPDTIQDPRFADNPLVTAAPNIRFYAGVPLITPTGHAIGTLCVIDQMPKQLTPEQITALRILGQQVVSQLEFRQRTMTLERVLISQKQGDESLRESEQRYRTLVECAPFCIHEIDLQGRLLSMNPAGLAMMGAKDEREIVSLLYPDVVAPVDRKRVEALLDRACAGEASTFEFSVQAGRADCRVASCFVPIKGDDGVVTRLMGITQDITERKRDEEALRLARFSMDRAADAVYWVDSQAKILDANEAASLMLGYSKDELCAMTVHDLNPDFQADIWPEFWAETKRCGTRVMETAHRAKNGQLIPIEVSVNYLAYEGKEYHCAFVRDITDRKRAEAILKEHQAGLMAAQELSHLGSWEWDIPTGTEQWSAEQYRIFGYAPNSIEVTYDLFKQALHIEDRERVLAAVEAALNERTPYDVECRILHPSGEVRFVQCRGEVVRDVTGQPVKMRGTVLDITERKRAERALRLTQYAVDRGADMAFWMDRDARILYVNDAACQRLGYVREELLAMTISDLDPDYQLSRWRQHWTELKEHTRFRFEARHRTKSGDIYPVEVAANYVAFEGQEYNFAFCRDITERREAEATSLAHAKELEQINRSLDLALHQAKAAMQAKSNFLSTMSHEIRTPMNGVIGMTGLLLDTDLTSEQREYAETVRTSGEHLLMIINDILDFSKTEAGKMALEIIDFDLRIVVDETLDLVAKSAADKGVNLASLVYANVPSAVRGDPGRLRQILLNILSNAIKFTDQGEVVLSVLMGQGTDEEVTVRFEIQDTGTGLSAEAQGRLFQSFSQADNSTTRKYGGTGLGLAICKQLTELMGGQIGVESQPGAGSTFWFTVSLAAQAPGTASVDGQPSQSLHGRSLCIVNDHATNRRILDAYATKWGLRCRLAVDGQEALACLRTAAEEGAACDFAIIDMQVPGMDGLELARVIKADRLLAPTRLILLTSQGRRGDAKVAQTAGYAAYLTKPVHEGQLYECLLAVINPSVPAPPRAGQSEHQPVSAALITRHSLAEAKTQITLKILLAEDNVINQKVAVRMLAKLGYRVDVVANGKEALEALGRIDYAAVLMDCHMPEMDGFTATAEIRKRETLDMTCETQDEIRKTCDAFDVKCNASSSAPYPRTSPRRIPIIAMTASVLPEDRTQCLAVGMDDYITKPVQSKVLAEVLARWVLPAPPVSAGMSEAGSSLKDETVG